MTQETTTPKLPLELILRVLESLRPATAVALKPNDPATITYKSFMLTCRATYPTALRLLYSHCLYIDSSDRLRRLLISLNHHLQITHPIDFDKETSTSSHLTHTIPTPTTSHPSTLPHTALHPHLQNLYLSPFPPNSIDDLPTAQWIFELLSLTRHTLRRLIAVIPLSTLPPWKDHLSVRSWLRRGFEELSAIEEFVCVCDELDLTVYEEVFTNEALSETPIWARWKALRRLSLRNFDMSRPRFGYLRDLQRLERFAMVVTLHPYEQATWDVVFERFGAGVELVWPAVARHDSMVRDGGGEGFHLARLRWAREWSERNGGGLRLRAVVVDPEWVRREEETEAYLVHLQSWMTERALEGEWWDVETCSRFTKTEIDQDLFFDSTTARGTWPDEWRMDRVAGVGMQMFL